MDNIVIIGSSGHAKVIIDIVQREGKYNIVGLLDRYRKIDEQTLGYRVLGTEEDLPVLMNVHSLKGAIVAIGDNFIRSKEAARVREILPELPFVCAIHPRASIATDVSIGEGTVIMAGACINPCSSVGRFCILNTNSSLDHDSTMDDFASLAPGVTTGSNCRIGAYSAISIGAVLIHGVHIGEQSVIGAASLVTKPIESFVVAYGTPARAIRKRQPGDKYL
jgi:sugar O-acyltransferase (sialic acid O-acetyltransferase NeuD family)